MTEKYLAPTPPVLDSLDRHNSDSERGLGRGRSLSERDINDICKCSTLTLAGTVDRSNTTCVLDEAHSTLINKICTNGTVQTCCLNCVYCTPCLDRVGVSSSLFLPYHPQPAAHFP